MNYKDIEEKYDVWNYQSPYRYKLLLGVSSVGKDYAAIADSHTGLIRCACDEFWRDWINLKQRGLVKSVSGPLNHVDLYVL